MPFGKYKTFKQCVEDNRDKEKPEAYCASLERKIRGPRGTA